MGKIQAVGAVISEKAKRNPFARDLHLNLKNDKGNPFVEMWELGDTDGADLFADSWWYGLVPRDYAPIRAYKVGRLVTVTCNIGRGGIQSEDHPWDIADWQAINPANPLPWLPDSRIDTPILWSGLGGTEEKQFPGSTQILQNGVMMAGNTGAGASYPGDSTFVEGRFSISYVASV